MQKKAIVAMSGGVDSSVAAALGLEQGLQCIGLTLKLHQSENRCCSLKDVNDAKNVSSALGMEHYVLNFASEFDSKVISHFAETYEQGETPNPCIECNRSIKFNLKLLYSKLGDFDYYITGHYAHIKYDCASGRYLLLKASMMILWKKKKK